MIAKITMERGILHFRNKYSQVRIYARLFGAVQKQQINDQLKEKPNATEKKKYFSTGISVNNLPKVTYINNATQSSETANNVLDIANSYLYNCQDDNIVQCVEALQNRMFKLVCETYPWPITECETMLCVQTFVSNECRSLFSELVESNQMKSLFEQILGNITKFSNKELVTLTRALVRLQVKPSDEVLIALCSECIGRCATFDLDDSYILSVAGNHLGRSGFFLMGLIVNNFSNYLNTLEPSHENYNKIGKIIGNVDYFCSAEMIREIISKYSDGGKLIFSDEDLEYVDLESTMNILESFCRFGKTSMPIDGKFVAPLTWHIEKYLDKLTLRDLAKLWLNLIVSRHRTNGLVNVIKTRAAKHLHSRELTPTDVISFAIIFAESKEMTQTLQNILIDNLHKFDLLTLSQLSAQKFLFSTDNLRLITAFSDQVLKCLPDVSNSLTCLQRIVFAFTKLKTYPLELDKILSVQCLEKLEECVPIQSSQTFCIFLLRRSLNCGYIPPILLETLRTRLPNFSTEGLLVVKDGIEKTKHFLKFPINIMKIARSSVIEKLRSTSNLRLLNFILSKSTSTTLCNYCPEINECIAEKYLEFIAQVNLSNLRITSNNVREFKIYLPELFEKLVDVCIKEKQILANDLLDIIRTLATCNYVPNEMNKLETVFVSKASQHNIDISDFVSGLFSLSILGSYPESLLLRVFSLDFLRKFDQMYKYTNNGKQTQRLQKILALLNRSVILHLPHLNVPWFNENFVRNSFIESKISLAVIKWKNDVEEQLIEIFGNDGRIRKNAESDYHHPIDFEIYLDDKNNAVTKQSNMWTTKIAIIILTPTNFCSNAQHLIGNVTATLNELEILEYKVVAIPYFDLDSMHLCDKSNLQSYLKQKMFKGKTFL